MRQFKLILLTLSIVLTGQTSLMAQQDTNDKLTPGDRKYTGRITKEDFLTEDYTKSWFNSGMENFKVSDEMLEKFKNTDYRDYSITVFMGTWCHDSKREVPRLYKLLEKLDFDLEKLTVYAVNYQKNTEENYEKGLNIHHVPTIIVYDENGEEIDRYVERPRQSFLKDMLKIFQKKEYKDHYKK